MFDQLTNTESDDDGDRDRIFNTETRRALRRGVHQLRIGAVGLGAVLGMAALAAFATLGAIHGTIPLTLAIGSTLVVTLAGPSVAAYVMLRVSGLSHSETVETAKRAFNAALGEAPTLTNHPDARNGPQPPSGEPPEPRAGGRCIHPENTLQPPADPNTDEPTYTIGDNHHDN